MSALKASVRCFHALCMGSGKAREGDTLGRENLSRHRQLFWPTSTEQKFKVSRLGLAERVIVSYQSIAAMVCARDPLPLGKAREEGLARSNKVAIATRLRRLSSARGRPRAWRRSSCNVSSRSLLAAANSLVLLATRGRPRFVAVSFLRIE